MQGLVTVCNLFYSGYAIRINPDPPEPADLVSAGPCEAPPPPPDPVSYTHLTLPTIYSV